MAEFRRLISYLYEYEGKVKGKNVGFVKLETRNGLCKLNVSVKKIYLGSGNLGVYLLSARREIFLGNLFLRNGSGEFRTVVQAADIEQSGETMDDCYGLTMHEKTGAWKVYTTIWEDSAAQAAEVAAAPVLEEVASKSQAGSSTESVPEGMAGSRLSGGEEREKPSAYEVEPIGRTEGKAETTEQAEDNLEERAEQVGYRTESAERAEPREERVGQTKDRNERAEQAGQREEHAGQTGHRNERAEQAEQRGEHAGQTEQRTESAGQIGRRNEHAGQRTESAGQIGRREEHVAEQTGQRGEHAEQAGDRNERAEQAGIAEGTARSGYRTEGTEQVEQRTESTEQGKHEAGNENLEEKGKNREKQAGERKEASAREGRNVNTQPFAMNRNMRSRMNNSGYNNNNNHNTNYNNNHNTNYNNNNHNNNNHTLPRRPQGQLFFNMRPQTASASSAGMPSSRGESSASAVSFPRTQAFAPAEASVVPPPSTQQFAPAGPGTVPVVPSQQSMSAVHRPEEKQQSFIRQNEDEPLIIGDPEALAKLEEEEKTTPVPLWDFLSKTYPKIQAFECQYGCEILVIKPQDIGLLPREVWIYGNNSFLLHGYYNYRYLILARLENPHGNPRHLLGVPGHYYSNEKYMASMFGFPNFVLSKKQQEQDGRFGYWYTDIRLGDGNVASAVIRHVQKP